MKFNHKIKLLSISLVVMMFILVYGRFNPDSMFSWSKSAGQERIVKKITEYMEKEDATVSDDELKDVATMIYKESGQNNLDYRLILAIMKIESNFKHKAVSSKGARGLLQVKPSHAKFIARDMGIAWHGAKTLDEPDKNIKIGIHFFSELMEDFENINMALHAYNMGPTRLKEIMSEKSKQEKGFSKLVLREYRKNMIILPDPQ
ncbi:MAG: lytic transglycosylase domain-containing protein [Proteobacteria bacterium]|nr:lytic transglycosylase domain-containing protein [Pseudomonadota bacterium]